jgi:hypothetical protein
MTSSAHRAARSRGRHRSPKVVELACCYLELTESAPLSLAERRALLRDTSQLPANRPPLPDEAQTRESLYEDRIARHLSPPMTTHKRKVP